MIKSINEGIRIIDKLQAQVNDLNNQIKQIDTMILELRLEPDSVSENNQDDSFQTTEDQPSNSSYIFEGGVKTEEQ